MYNINPTSSSTKREGNVTDRLKLRLDELQRRNQHLEVERRSRLIIISIEFHLFLFSLLVIQEKLEELISNNYSPPHLSNSDPNRFLSSMKQQQDLNEKAMDFLRQRLIFP